MSYTKGTSANIVVGAAALFINNNRLGKFGAAAEVVPPAILDTIGYKETVGNDEDWTSVGYTSNGLEISFEPDFGEVKVDQLLDVAKLFKQGMKVMLKTTFAEATLENLLVAIAAKEISTSGDDAELDLLAGELGEYPVERSLIAVGASTEKGSGTTGKERIYIANRVLSIQNVTVSAKRDAATEFEVNFRLLPDDNGSYGKIVDHSWTD